MHLDKNVQRMDEDTSGGADGGADEGQDQSADKGGGSDSGSSDGDDGAPRPALSRGAPRRWRGGGARALTGRRVADLEEHWGGDDE
jgi:hypothetical protein